MEVYAWRDLNDKNNYNFGTKYESTTGKLCYCLWFTVFIDGLYEVFGKDFSDECKKIGTEPIKVKFDAFIKILKSDS